MLFIFIYFCIIRALAKSKDIKCNPLKSSSVIYQFVLKYGQTSIINNTQHNHHKALVTVGNFCQILATRFTVPNSANASFAIRKGEVAKLQLLNVPCRHNKAQDNFIVLIIISIFYVLVSLHHFNYESLEGRHDSCLSDTDQGFYDNIVS